MSRTYSITEPHPSPATHYIHSGRGGAGNVAKINPATLTPGSSATGPASAAPLRPAPAGSYFAAGRGGAGNMHHARERAIFSFDEELARQSRMMENQAPYYHVGRGGAGNLVGEESARRRESASSNESSGSVRHSLEAGLNKLRSIGSRH